MKLTVIYNINEASYNRDFKTVIFDFWIPVKYL